MLSAESIFLILQFLLGCFNLLFVLELLRFHFLLHKLFVFFKLGLSLLDDFLLLRILTLLNFLESHIPVSALFVLSYFVLGILNNTKVLFRRVRCVNAIHAGLLD